MFAYSNNGATFVAVSLDYVAQSGEVIFPDYATAAELQTAFPGYVANAAVVPEALSRWQFFTVAALSSIITQAQAQAALTGTLPQPFVDFIATLPTAQQFPATMLLAGTQTFDRHHPFVQAFLQAKGMTDAQADALWIQGAALTLS